MWENLLQFILKMNFLSGTSSRVSNYKSYLKVIKWLTNRNYTVVRFVHDKSIKKIYDHKKYYELTTNGERENKTIFFNNEIKIIYLYTKWPR